MFEREKRVFFSNSDRIATTAIDVEVSAIHTWSFNDLIDFFANLEIVSTSFLFTFVSAEFK